MSVPQRDTPLQSPDPTTFSTLKYEASLVHPVAAIEANARSNETASRRRLQAAVFGTALPIRRAMERSNLAQFRRIGGLQSSNLGLQLLDRVDESIDFADYLNVEMPDLPTEDPRETLEKDIGLFVKSEL